MGVDKFKLPPSFSTEVKTWTNGTKSDLKVEMRRLRIKNYSGQLSGKLRSTVSTKRTTQEPFKIAFKFPRYGVFVHKGVGKGTKAAQVGNTNRIAKDWFNGPIQKRLGKLADIAERNYADAAVRSIFIK